MTSLPHVTAFAGPHAIAAGTLDTVALALRAHSEPPEGPPTLTFDDATGQVVDIDLRGTDDEVLARLHARFPAHGDEPAPRGRGRPRLGVVAREVTLLPRHWEWLAAQRGGASAAIRRLVEEARRSGGALDGRRQAEERTYRFIAAMAGDLPGFEAATRALFAHDERTFGQSISDWPPDIQAYALRLLREDS